MMKTACFRNVNSALAHFVSAAAYASPDEWRVISPRNMETVEYRDVWVTQYSAPTERVLFSHARDANPFFHLMESLWILAGSKDVKFLTQFNANIANFSDDGVVFHAPYGYRLRRHFMRPAYERLNVTSLSGDLPKFCGLAMVDQIAETIELLKTEPDTRRAVMAIWDPAADCNTQSKDIPCNDLIMFKLRDGRLHMTVCCRSNDAIWGAYGANAVQFSILQEFIASACGVMVGNYTQVSDSMHVYTTNPAWQRLLASRHLIQFDPYETGAVSPCPLLQPGDNWRNWLAQCELFVSNELEYMQHTPRSGTAAFFVNVAYPIRKAWDCYKDGRAETALALLFNDCAALDWRRACMEWIQRRS